MKIFSSSFVNQQNEPHNTNPTSKMHSHDDSCAMNMSFTWSYHNTCIIFSWWRLTSLPGLIMTCLILSCLSIFYEWFKLRLHLYSTSHKSQNLIKSIGYGLQVAFSFIIMLVFMTYNGWLMGSVVGGAIIGHYYFNHRLENRYNNGALLGDVSLACH